MKQAYLIRRRQDSIRPARTCRPLLLRQERHTLRFLFPVLSCIALMALPLYCLDSAEPRLFSPLDDVPGLGLLLMVGIAPALGFPRHLAARRLARPGRLPLASPNANACLTNCHHQRTNAPHVPAWQQADAPRPSAAGPDDALRACCPASHGRPCPSSSPVSR